MWLLSDAEQLMQRLGENMTNEELLARIEKLEKDNARLHAVQEIQNLMAHYELLQNQKNMELHPMDFAMDRDDVSVQIADGKPLIGPEGVKSLFCGLYNIPEEEYRGIMLIHYLTTPAIEVAEDGQTARGLWWSPGIETIKREKGGEPDAAWCFGAYANDFILENGVWKIWHMRWFLTCKCPYTEGWADQRYFYPTKVPHARHANADKSYNPYTKDYIQEAIPMRPRPYKTWDDERWYMTQEDRSKMDFLKTRK